MPIMRFKLIGTNMVERPTKGEWVRWDDVKDFINPKAGYHDVETFYTIPKPETARPPDRKIENDETTSDNKRSRK